MSTTVAPKSTRIEQDEQRIQPRGLKQRFLFRWIDSFEKQSGVSAEYARWMASVSPRAFMKFGKLGKLAQYRRALPADASAVAHLVAARSEDCGPCVQIGINFAKHDGVSSDILRAVYDRQPDRLPPELADVYHFAESVVAGGERNRDAARTRPATLRRRSADRAGAGNGGRPDVPAGQTDDRLRQELLADEDRDLAGEDRQRKEQAQPAGRSTRRGRRRPPRNRKEVVAQALAAEA